MHKILIKAGKDFEIRPFRLDLFQDLTGVVHSCDRVLDSDDIGEFQSQTPYDCRADAVTGTIREIVQINRPVDVACHMREEIVDLRISEGEVIRRYDHNCVRARIQDGARETDDLIGDHAGGSDDQGYSLIDMFNCEPCHCFTLPDRLSEKLTDTAANQNTAYAGCNQIVK